MRAELKAPTILARSRRRLEKIDKKTEGVTPPVTAPVYEALTRPNRAPTPLSRHTYTAAPYQRPDTPSPSQKSFSAMCFPLAGMLASIALLTRALLISTIASTGTKVAHASYIVCKKRTSAAA